METMTKEDLYKNLNWLIATKQLDVAENLLDQFFKDKVIIQKGENRHKQADIIHAYAEGIIVQRNDKRYGWQDLIYDSSELRIKPSEPVYEYIYLRIDGDKAYETEDFLTEEEAKALGYKVRMEKTKRPRE